ncbi:MAG: phospholipid carrier-dependent glycosyltransferase [Flavipsychrobacter sp.]|nr:phospholipid carrier-dependent glycosyltransferase [Flavipsychrobacter sp.]
MKEKIMPYLPGIILLVLGIIVSLLTYQDYGIGWDEPYQRGPGLLSYNYMFHGNPELFLKETDNHGAGFELFLLFFEKGLGITDTRDIYMNRHLVTNIVYLLSAFAGYVLVLKMFKNNILPSLGFIILAFTPRLYAHSFFNSKDVPFMCMILVTLAVARAAFDNRKVWLYLIMGLVCGYATSIRIMGVMLFSFLLLFLLIDLFTAISNKEKPLKPVLNTVLFTIGFCFSLYISWPYLWPKPIHNFVESFRALSHFKWGATTLISGKMVTATSLPWTYIPQWFLITTPVLWLIAGFAGIGLVIYNFSKTPMQYLRNTPERNLLLYVLCFFVPVLSVIVLHSVVYDDWRHVFFIYPPFILLALYFINRFMQAKYKMIVQGVCALQVAMLVFFMVKDHPFQQLYFNELVSHEDEYLRRNYELDYWGLSFKQALDHITEMDNRKDINVCSNLSAYIENNTLGLRPEDRKRVHFTPPDQADYFITNYRGHPEDYDGVNVDYSISVLNSTVLQIFKLRGPQVKLR